MKPNPLPLLIDGRTPQQILANAYRSGLIRPPVDPRKKTPAQIEAYKAKRRRTIARCQAAYKRRMACAQMAEAIEMSRLIVAQMRAKDSRSGNESQKDLAPVKTG